MKKHGQSRQRPPQCCFRSTCYLAFGLRHPRQKEHLLAKQAILLCPCRKGNGRLVLVIATMLGEVI
jgi:hypothetical protein